MNTPLTVGLVQQSCTEDRNANLNASLVGVRDAAKQGAELVLLQELHTGVYFCQNEDVKRFDQAEPIPGPTTETLAAIAKELGIVIVGSLFERRAPGMYHNTAVVFERDGTLAGQYRKMHIPDDPGFHENLYFTPGDQGFRADPDLGRRTRRIGVLGPVVSRGRAPDGDARRQPAALSDRHRLGSEG